MDSDQYLKFLAWVAEHFGYLGMLVLILVGLLFFLGWKMWKGLELAIRELTTEVVAMHDSQLLSLMAMPISIAEFRREAEKNQAALNERQRKRNS